MQITYGIITGGGQEEIIARIMDTVDVDEFIVVGDCDLYRKNLKIIPFSEKGRVGHITKKKNMITQAAKNEIIVYSHDYMLPCKGWCRGMEQFGDNWDVQMHQIFNLDGTRYRDWCLSPSCSLPEYRSRERLLPYNVNMTDKMYVSGAYWVAKKEFMQQFPLDESLGMGDGEDIEWSERMRGSARYVMNPDSAVMCMKAKWVVFKEIAPDLLGYVKERDEN